MFAQYTVRVGQRDSVAARLREQGIPTAVYYPRAPASAAGLCRAARALQGDLDVAERAVAEVLSLPMSPFVQPEEQQRVAAALTR